MISFIHIPKNAGSSIKKVSEQHNQIKYHYHDVDPNTINGDRLIILRNPVSRFVSAVCYALTVYYKVDNNVKEILQNSINSPDLFASAFFDNQHPNHNLITKEVNNSGSHRIGNNVLKYKWTYEPQIMWVQGYQPKYVILYENLRKEFKMLMSKLQINVDELPAVNVTRSGLFTLSEKNVKLISNLYSKDFDMYNFYKDMDVEKRLSL